MVTGQWFYKRLKLFMIALVTLLTLPLQGALIATLQVDTVSQLEVWFEGHIDPPTGAGAPIGGAIVNTINWSFPSMHWDSYTGGTTFNVHVSTEHFVAPHPGDGPFGDPLTWTAPAQTFFACRESSAYRPVIPDRHPPVLWPDFPTYSPSFSAAPGERYPMMLTD